jgi:hypothetical protein
MTATFVIRPYLVTDAAAVREVNRQAFRTPEPGTFEKLRDTLADARAWVAAAARSSGCRGSQLFHASSTTTVRDATS